MNPVADGRISWECESSYTSDLDKEVKRLQNQLHKVTMLNYNMMIRSLRYIMNEARELPTCEGNKGGDELLNKSGRLGPKQ